jgi:hypothetical protein
MPISIPSPFHYNKNQKAISKTGKNKLSAKTQELREKREAINQKLIRNN